MGCLKLSYYEKKEKSCLRIAHSSVWESSEKRSKYYPYGLKIAGISSRKLGDASEGHLQNPYQYQADYSEFDDETQWNEFELRNYDPQIGRFVQVDPFDQFPSPYTGMGNDPVNNVDPSGGWAATGLFQGLSTGARIGVTTLGGAIAGAIVDGVSGGNGKGIWMGALAGLASNFIGSGASTLSVASMGIQALSFGVNVTQANNQNFTLKDVITYGKGSARFTSLLSQAGINDNNYSSEISFGSNTATTPTAPYKITLNKTSLQATTLGLAHELTNRINGAALAKFTTDVGTGAITPEQFADRTLGVEANGVLNQIVVGSQLNMQAAVAGNQPYYEMYKTGGVKEDALIKKINKNIRKINLADGGGNAYDFYRKKGAAYRKAMKAYEKQMEEYNKKYKKNG
jgi:RHS repeat-associated protein